MMRTIVRSVISLGLSLVVLLMNSSVALLALSAEQLQMYNSGILYYDVDPMTGACQVATPSTALNQGSSVYVLGDSITNAARSNIETEIINAGFTVSGINADPGRAIATDTAGSEPSGLEAIQLDAAIISQSDAIVIALGTNSRYEDLNTLIPQLIGSITAINPSISIYWVNLFHLGSMKATHNATITNQATHLGFTVIDTTTATIELQPGDEAHPTAAGNAVFASVIAAGLRSTTPTASASPAGVWDPITLRYPAIPNEAELIRNTERFILEGFPTSPFARNLQYVTQIFTLSREHDVNPLLVMSVAQQENGFGQAVSSATANNNYFGITQGNGYRSFGSVEEGIAYFVEKVGRHVTNPTGAYTGLTNFYEYLSIHQVGLIAYPGEYPEGSRGADAIPPYLSFDVRMDVYTSWDPSRNSHMQGSPIFNPGIYFKNSITMINKITGLSLPDTPDRNPAGQGGGGCSEEGGTVSANGYAFPLAPQRKVSYSTLPCNNDVSCHHDGTAAFDLSYADVQGKSVYAIIEGTIDRISTQEAGWCQSIQLRGKDGFYYWYGHVIDVSVAEGQTVTTGQEIAKVATWTQEHTCNGTSRGNHLHIDRGCSIDGVPQRGGNDSCRDPAFIPLLNEIYNGLPS